jgi:3-dehydroquinate synthase
VTDTTETVRVDLSERSYDIQIGADNMDQAGSRLCETGRVSHAVIITDENVEQPHGDCVAQSLVKAGVEVALVIVDPGEPTKSIESAAGLWEQMLKLGADRKTVVVAVGGGVVGDLAGFVAATYARGVRFFQVPTTLLAQVDSSVGGKVGINLPTAKNMVGAFLQPVGVLIDTRSLDTLEAREYKSGLGEVVKYGVILDADLFEYLEANVKGLLDRDHEVLGQVVSRCCRLKADVVEKDEREESGVRAVLNYGHTFGHAIETLSGYGRFLHGEAVSIGMLCASRLAQRLGRVDAQFTARQEKLLAALDLPTQFPDLDSQKVVDAMMHDKKVEHGRLRFVLPSEMGRVELVGDVDPDAVRAALKS